MRTLLSALIIAMLQCCSHPHPSGIHHMDPADFEKEMHASSNKLILDVRTPEEYQAGHLEGAMNIDFNSPDFHDKVEAMDTGKTIFIYCEKGGRSASAADYLQHHGFSHIYDLYRGISAWADQGKPVVTK